MNDLNPLSITLKVINSLDELKIDYILAGSLASALYGVSRSTLDADLIADFKEEQIEPFIHSLGAEFIADPEMMRTAVQGKGSFNLIHRQSMFKIDIFIPKDAFDRAELQRRQTHVLEKGSGLSGFVATAEDTILAKLRWFRLGNEVSDRQWQDILGILKVQRDRLDCGLMSEWAGKIGVSDLLAKALAEAKMS